MCTGVQKEEIDNIKLSLPIWGTQVPPSTTNKPFTIHRKEGMRVALGELYPTATAPSMSELTGKNHLVALPHSFLAVVS
jgi:hypothetical protein